MVCGGPVEILENNGCPAQLGRISFLYRGHVPLLPSKSDGSLFLSLTRSLFAILRIYM
jgi:hypothetical protein